MPAPLTPGETLKDRYLVRRIIGRGGMGCVYLAEDNRLPGRMCALKEVEQDPDLPHELRAQGREQFYREASLLARLDHPNLPKVSDFFSHLERDYLVMDFVAGDDLKTLMEGARRRGEFLNQEDVLLWASQLAGALTYLHTQDPPIIHRDIKPSNLKLTPTGILKLVDFGLVKQMIPGEMTITVIQGHGTALYTPLEQYGGDTGHTDARTDVYAFGATLYHLLTNQGPAEAKQRFLHPDSLKPPRTLNPSISPQVERAILWAMELHPDQRPQDVRALQAALLQDVPPPTSPIPTPAATSLADLLPTLPDKALAALALALLAIAFAATLS